MTLQDIVRLRQSGETVSALAEQVSQLNYLVQDTVLQRLTVMEIVLPPSHRSTPARSAEVVNSFIVTTKPDAPNQHPSQT